MIDTWYNDNDPFVAQWLRNLIAAGGLPDGAVNENPIQEVQTKDCLPTSHFFAGIGGWAYALNLAGWPQDRPVWTGSCPCQPFSVAGRRGGTTDERHLWPEWFRLIKECRPPTIFGEQVASKDGYAWFDIVQADLESLGYACGMVVSPAAGYGAPHIRHRIYFVADTESGRVGFGLQGERKAQPTGTSTVGTMADADGGDSSPEGIQRGREHGQQPQDSGTTRRLANTSRQRRQQNPRGAFGYEETNGRTRRDEGQPNSDYEPSSYGTHGFWADADWLPCTDGKARPTQPGLFPLVDGLPIAVDGLGPISRVGTLRGAGNAIVPQAAAAFIRAYMKLTR